MMLGFDRILRRKARLERLREDFRYEMGSSARLALNERGQGAAICVPRHTNDSIFTLKYPCSETHDRLWYTSDPYRDGASKLSGSDFSFRVRRMFSIKACTFLNSAGISYLTVV